MVCLMSLFVVLSKSHFVSFFGAFAYSIYAFFGFCFLMLESVWRCTAFGSVLAM